MTEKPKPFDLEKYYKWVEHEEKIYHVWHYCLKCGKIIRHSTAEMRDHVESCGGRLLTFPSSVKKVVVPISLLEILWLFKLAFKKVLEK